MLVETKFGLKKFGLDIFLVKKDLGKKKFGSEIVLVKKKFGSNFVLGQIFLLLQESSSWVKIGLHAKNQLPGWSGSGLNVPVVVVVGGLQYP